MDLKRVSYWVLSGLIIFPVLMILGILFYALSLGKINALFWMIMPSVFFEEFFESCCYAVSNSVLFNFIFIVLFWFTVGALVGLVCERLKRK